MDISSTFPDALEQGIQGGATFDRMLTYSEDEWAIVEKRRDVLEQVRRLRVGSRARSLAVLQAAAALSVDRSTVYRLLSRANGEIIELFPRRPGPRAGLTRLAPGQEAVFQRAVRQYLNRQRITMAELVRRVQKDCLREGLAPISRHAVQLRIDRMDQLEVATKRGEKRIIDALTLRPGVFAERAPMEWWQIDHTPIDVLAISAIDGKVLGRPYLTLIIDVGTRMVAGYCLSWERPSALRVAMALTCAVSPKNALLERLGLDGDWPVLGLPLALHSDNAAEFARSLAYRRGCANYNISLELRTPGRPRDGAHIERLIGTMMARCHFLPGTTFSDVRAKADYDSVGKARLTLPELERWLVEQILDYHDRRHSGLGCSPRQAWEAMVREQEINLSLPKDLDQFRLSFLPLQSRKIQRIGVQLKALEYYHPVLADLRRHNASRVELRYDPLDLSRVYVRSRQGVWVAVPIKYPDCPPITLMEVEAEQRRRKALGLGPASGSQLVAEIVRQRRAWEGAVALGKHQRRVRERVAEGNRTCARRGPNSVDLWAGVMGSPL